MRNYRPYAGIGSRETPVDTLLVIEETAFALQELGWMCRSGRAPGADQAFERGADPAAEIYLPWANFEKGAARVKATLTQPHPDAYRIAQSHHPAWERLRRAGRTFHARNAHQILGGHLDSPVEFVLCWTPGGKHGGGTGQAIRHAESLDIPVIDLGACAHPDAGVVLKLIAAQDIQLAA